MIKLYDLLEVLDEKEIRVNVPVTKRLRARLTVELTSGAELEDLVQMYGNHIVKGIEVLEGTGRVLITLEDSAVGCGERTMTRKTGE